MVNSLTYHQAIKNEQHVFIYCVAGRSSSTAFQRIINSSNKVWIWGERNGLLDDTILLINQMKILNSSSIVKDSLKNMYNSYTNNKHIDFYPNAIGNLDNTIDLINSSISNLLKPCTPKLKRFGFKDIQIKDIQTIEYLKESFPQSFFLFCFRNPLQQWPSVNKLQDWWKYSKELLLFLDEYSRLSNIYMEFAAKHNIRAFIENNDLRNQEKIKKIIEYINISRIDSSLINFNVSTVNNKTLSEADEIVILNSKAYKNYMEMRNISASFY